MKVMRMLVPGVVLLCSLSAWAGERSLKILLIYDFEGCTGVTRAQQVMAFGGEGYEEARRSLEADVNAAIEGLAAGGATEIVVVDGHGSMNTAEPEVRPDRLRSPARQLTKDERFDAYLDSYDPSFDGIVAVAFHAGAGNESGFLRHTINLADIEYRIDGVLYNEAMLMAAAAARNGIPFLMVSGDDQLAREVGRMLPWVRTAVVKRALGVDRAEPLERAEASRRITRAAREAVEGIASARLPERSGPCRFALKFMTDAQAEAAADTPGTTRPDHGRVVEFRAQDFEEGYRAARGMMNRAMQAGMMEALDSVIAGRPDKDVLMMGAFDWWIARWTLQVPAEPEGAAPEPPKEQHWGAR